MTVLKNEKEYYFSKNMKSCLEKGETLWAEQK